MKRGIVLSKDVLLYKDGAYTGKSSMALNGFPHKECAVNEHVFILRTNSEINQFYLYLWLDQEIMTNEIINLKAEYALKYNCQTGLRPAGTFKSGQNFF